MIRSKALFVSVFFILGAFLVFNTNSAWAGKRHKKATTAVVAPMAAATQLPSNVVLLGDGAVQNNRGGWDLPAQGTCPAGAAQGYTGIDTRPECVALRLNVNPCTGNYSSTTNGVCNDLVNNTQNLCQAAPDRLWNPSTNLCSIVMMDDDRNNLTCAKHGGTWVTTATCTGSWIMPARTAYTPSLLTGNSPGDQCLRCHNTTTQYNSPRVRDTEDTLYMGHKNMSRPYNSTTHYKWGGPDFKCSIATYTNEEDCIHNNGTWDPTTYPSDDSGNVFNWNAGTITTPTGVFNLLWIYGDWLSALPRAIYQGDRAGTCSLAQYNNLESQCNSHGGTYTITGPAMSYSCARCHTTGWTSDATMTGTPADPRLKKEPERDFPGITWDPTAKTGYINVKGGVSGDANNFASWNQWGILCSRCHSSAIDTGKGDASTPIQYSAPTGMSSHHSNLTTADNTSGVCTDPNWTAEAQCTTAGAQWLTNCSTNPTTAVCTQAITTQGACVSPGVWVSAPGFCSNAFYSDQTSCEANAFVWQAGWCTRPDIASSATCTGGSGTSALTWRTNGTQASCQVAGATWSGFSECSLEGYCNKGTNVTTKAACDNLGGQFAYATDIIRCGDAGGRWTGSNTNRGPIIVSLCMNCHRQEASGLPIDAAAPGINLKVGVYHGTLSFLSHPHANQFLNSPHGEYTGTFAAVSTSKKGSGFGSDFMDWGEAANTGNGCTGCHDVHTSTVVGEKPFHAECTECHSNPERATIQQVDLSVIRHPFGTGTPIENINEPSEACASCHMPGGLHLWRINTSSTYSTFPIPAAFGGTQNANFAAEGNNANAVWVDLDAACGQCHGGGTTFNSNTAQSITTTAPYLLTMQSSAGFAANQRVRIVGAGSLYYDDQGQGHNADFDSYIIAVTNGTTIQVAGLPPASVVGKSVVQNPTKNGAPYYPKTALAAFAVGMHNGTPPSVTVRFSATLDPANSLKVNVDASASACANAPCTYDWNWGDGNQGLNGNVTTSHTYTTAGPKAITLTMTDGTLTGSATVNITTYAPDAYPVAAYTLYAVDPNTWTVSFTDSSTDDHAPGRGISVSWGDGSPVTTKAWGSAYSHSYITVGPFTINITATDSVGQTNKVQIQVPAFSYFSISGKIFAKDGVTPIASATVQIKKGTTLVKQVYSASDGSYTTGLTLKPGTYTIVVTKTGFTFTNPAATVGVGNSKTQDVIATGP